MVSFFMLWAGVRLWLAMAGVICLGVATVAMEARTSTSTFKAVLFAVAGVVCVGMAVVNALMDWGIVALATYAVLACGGIITVMCAAFSHVHGYDWHNVPAPFAGGAASLLVALVAFCVALPIVNTLEYEEYSYGTEVRALEYDPSLSRDHLVKRTAVGDYSFRYVHKGGDALGSRRCILGEERVVFLDEDSGETTYVEGEVTTVAKLDPLSGRPLEVQFGRTFHPATLYVLPSDVWDEDTAG